MSSMVMAPSQPLGAAHGEAGQRKDREPAADEDDVGQHPMLPQFIWREHGLGGRKAAIWDRAGGVTGV